MSKKERWIIAEIGFGVFLLIMLITEHTAWLDPLNRGIYDVMQRVSLQNTDNEANRFSQDLIVVGIDEGSLLQFGKWPWSRIITAQFLDRVANYFPQTVFLDFIYSSPEKPPFELGETRDEPFGRLISSWYAEVDETLARAMKGIPDVFTDLALLETADLSHSSDSLRFLI